jgi:hypothetical protein
MEYKFTGEQVDKLGEIIKNIPYKTTPIDAYDFVRAICHPQTMAMQESLEKAKEAKKPELVDDKK